MKEVEMIENETKPILKFNAEGVNPADMFIDAKKACLKAVDDVVEKHAFRAPQNAEENTQVHH